MLSSNHEVVHAEYLRSTALTLPRMGISPMEVCAIMSHWSSHPMDNDMWGLPRLHFMPDGSSRLLFGVTTDRFLLPAELRGRPRDSFPAAFFRRSLLTARAFDAAASIYLSLRLVSPALPLGKHLLRLMTAISGVQILPSIFPGVVGGLQGADRSIRVLAHRTAHLLDMDLDRAPTLHAALHVAPSLPPDEFSELIGAPLTPMSPPGAADYSSPLSSSDEGRVDLPPGEATANRIWDALFRTEAGLAEAISEPTPAGAHQRIARLERVVSHLAEWVRGCAALADNCANGSPADHAASPIAPGSPP